MRIVDNYFPQWMVDKNAEEFQLIPVTYTNSPYGQYEVSRFFGQLLIDEERWIAPIAPHWFVDYLHMCVCNDLLLDYKIQKLDRCLLNVQTPGQNAQSHTDWDVLKGSDRISGLYYIRGDGDTLFYTEQGETMHVECKPGRLVLFDSTIWHQGCPPVSEPIRYSLGYVWKCASPLSVHDPQDLCNPVPIL